MRQVPGEERRALNEGQSYRDNLVALVRGWGATFSSLESPNYRWFWLSSTASFAAMQMQMVVRGWLVYELTESALALGVVSAAAGAFIILFSLYGGAIADRVDKRNLLLVTQAAAGVATLIVAVLITMGAIEFWHLVIASIVNGLILAFRLPVRQAIIPELVEQRQVMNAVALSSGALNLNRIVAPALGGVLVGVIGIDGVYYLMVACFLISALLMLGVVPRDRTEEVPRPKAGVHNDIVEGVRYVRTRPVLIALLAIAIVPILFGMPYQMLMPIFAVDVLDVGVSGLGYLMAAVGIGALVGSLFVASVGDFRRKGLLLLATCGLFGAFLAAFANSHYFLLSMALLLGVGAANAGYMAVNNTLLQINVEDRMRGRVMSMYMMTIGLFPLGVLPSGAIAEVTGVALPVLVGGAIIVVFTVTMALLRPTLRRL
jgi:MFS family permease